MQLELPSRIQSEESGQNLQKLAIGQSKLQQILPSPQWQDDYPGIPLLFQKNP